MDCSHLKRFALAVAVAFVVFGATIARAADAPPVDIDARVEKLIGQLGSAEFAVREKAQGELERIGINAFDALNAARSSDDPEIALRARFLLQSLKVSWAAEDDSPDVKRILRNYDTYSEEDRKQRMERLARMEQGEGLRALCRIVRFEPSELLSKQAALRLMNRPDTPAEKDRLTAAAAIRSAIGQSKRSAAAWAKAYAGTLENAEASLAPWNAIVKAELETYHLAPDRSSREIARDLVRWQAELLRKNKRETEALAAMHRTLELLQGNRDEIVDTIDWAIEREAWSLVTEVAKRFPPRFTDDAELLYRLAEAHQKQQHGEEAEKTAEKALALSGDRSIERVALGVRLQERGLVDWAEREWRAVMKAGPLGSLSDLKARFLLAELLHDRNQELPAAEVLQGAVDVMDKDPAVLAAVQERLRREPGSIRSRMHYFYSEQAGTKGDRKEQRARLEKAITEDPADADVIIAMFRFPEADEAFKTKAREALKVASEQFRDEIETYKQSLDEASGPTNSPEWYELASAYNQYAWLIANTEGDFDGAIRDSLKSLELRPDTAGYLDTLAHCYAAKKDFENAVKYQSQAAKLEPSSLQIRKKLEVFQKSLADAKAAGGTRTK